MGTLDPLLAPIIKHHMQDAPGVGNHHLDDGLHLFGRGPSIQNTRDTPSSTAPDPDEAHMRVHGPQALSSSSSPNVSSSASQLRSPPPAIASTPDTPPFATFATNSSSSSPPPMPAGTFAQSPWHALAASGGAMTPSLEGPSSLQPRASPQLGRPFERLNLGGAWSASNLRPDIADQPSPPRPARAGVPSGAVSGGGMASPRSLQAPIALSGLAQRRALKQSMNLGGLRGGGGGQVSSPLTGAPSSPQASTSASASTSSKLKPLPPSALPSLVSGGTALILDIRPPSSFHESHLPNAHSIPVPSTLLRRPNFGISKLCQMLATASRDAVSRWRDKTDIIIVDQDSTVAVEGCVLLGLTAKFEREGFTGKLWFVSGGQAAAEEQDGVECVCDGPAENNATPPPDNSASLGIGRLPRLAFQNSSTGSGRGFTTAAANVRADPFQSLNYPGGLAPGTGQRLPQSADSSRSRLQPANPFFDNIRQNVELSHGGITERIPLALPAEVTRRASELPPFLRRLLSMNDSEVSDTLAKQFYHIERGEQKRLQNVMDTLTKGSYTPDLCKATPQDTNLCADDVEKLMTSGSDQSTYYPFSITAGVERGAKNRYKNIWPFDFSRVRLNTPSDDSSDYINASFVQPRGTTRRYIATQGPLDTTYRDFWTLVWEQNVRVIVMLTKQFEAGHVKCGNYWQEQEYGDLHLQLVSSFGDEGLADPTQTTGFDFGAAAASEPGRQGGNIIRTFHLWHNSAPNDPPRVISQVQCVDWPDFDIPDSPKVLLDLMKDVDRVAAETGIAGCGEDRCTFPPVLVHCSAGVGRTGSYILVDAITDALRQEMRSVQDPASLKSPKLDATAATTPSSNEPSGKMDVDASRLQQGTDHLSHSPEPDKPRPITQSHQPHHVSTPLSAMNDPILDVLLGMRVQRMSLVQSLRQYVFVHRAIITQAVEMLDEGSHRRSDVSDVPSAVSRTSAASATTTTSLTSTDDEAHIKRKPSSADLQPEADLRLQSVADLRLSEGSGGAVNLSKRASFKKRRGPTSSMPGSPHNPAAQFANAASTGTSSTTSVPGTGKLSGSPATRPLEVRMRLSSRSEREKEERN